MTSNTACIKREYLGGSEEITYEDFAMNVVQDDEVGRMVAEETLKLYPEPYVYNEGDSQFIERFTALSTVELFYQLLEADPDR